MTIYFPRPDCQIKDLGEKYTQLFEDKTDGTFVEVGAFDGVSYSNTVFLAELGWRGIYIEPDVRSYNKCVTNHAAHPKVECLNLAIGNNQGQEVTFKLHGDYSIGDPDMAAVLGATEDLYVAETTRLDTLLRYGGIQPGFELLVIDVDGMEMKVLWGGNLYYYRPQVVIIEAFQLQADTRLKIHTDDINSYMFRQGYLPFYFDEINTIFVKTKDIPSQV